MSCDLKLFKYLWWCEWSSNPESRRDWRSELHSYFLWKQLCFRWQFINYRSHCSDQMVCSLFPVSALARRPTILLAHWCIYCSQNWTMLFDLARTYLIGYILSGSKGHTGFEVCAFKDTMASPIIITFYPFYCDILLTSYNTNIICGCCTFLFCQCSFANEFTKFKFKRKKLLMWKKWQREREWVTLNGLLCWGFHIMTDDSSGLVMVVMGFMQQCIYGD